ncbi:MAG: hypothetical protein IT450_03060 [Phycisphaerales bacterium]|nr:hypothetical protein [Phycisphaerales bacterium]
MLRILPTLVGVATCSIGSSIFAQAPVATQPSPAPAAAQVDLQRLSIDELIGQLPPVTAEWTWDRNAEKGIEHPAVAELSRRLSTADDRAAAALMTDAQWLVALRRTGSIRVRTVWPRDAAYSVSVVVPRWLGLGRISLTPETPGLAADGVGETTPQWCGTALFANAHRAAKGLALGRVKGDPKEVVLQVQVEQGIKTAPFDSHTRTLWKGELRIPFRRVRAWTDVLTPADRKLADAIRDSLGAGVREWQDSPKVPYVVLDPDCAKFPDLAAVALDFKVQLLKDGQVVEESALVALDIDELQLMSSVQKDLAAPRFYGSANFEQAAAQFAADADKTRWSVRLTGRTKYAAYAWSATHRWRGSITVPWSDLATNEDRRTGPMGRGRELSTPFYE